MKRTESISSSAGQIFKKTQPEEFDLVILGDGTGSTIAARTFAGEDKRVAVLRSASCVLCLYTRSNEAARARQWLVARGTQLKARTSHLHRVNDPFIVRCAHRAPSLYESSSLLLVAHVRTRRLPFRF
jgi:hypothetical protein